MRGKWNEELLFSTAARKIYDLQMNHPLCHLNNITVDTLRSLVDAQGLVVANLRQNGLGSDLHTWTAMLCASVKKEGLMITNSHWVWGNEGTQELGDYFVQTHCNVDIKQLVEFACSHNISKCGSMVQNLNKQVNVLHLQSCIPEWEPAMTTHEWRAASIEFMFRKLSENLYNKVCDAFDDVFGPIGGVPRGNMISVHMR